ncbi:MAG: NAD(P)/FAD-dependent oxidoreductase [Candidatus Eremiobacteraeota bacterium]|nr:NAD(P)/FAD-dependent oxidoreductase [Candidatus Eremiobacteraeota bacterium]
MYDCIIVGAGPAGSHTAAKLAKMGFSVIILEEHREIGIPAHCTGIVGENVITGFNIPENLILKRIDSVRVHSPSKEKLILPTPIKPFVIDRVLFDRHLFQCATEAGADYLKSARVEDIQQKKDSVSVFYKNGKSSGSVEGKICIVAVGAMSPLSRRIGISGGNLSYGSAQLDVEIEEIEGIELFVGNEIAPGSFGYAVSTNGKIAKVGLIARGNAAGRLNSLLDSDFLKEHVVKKCTPPRFRRMPFGIVKNSVIGRILSVGDTACQVKSTTGGGVYYGMKSAEILSNTILESVVNGDFSLSSLKKYDHRWKKEIQTEISVGLFLRKFLENVNDDWWNRMPGILRSPGMKSLIEDYKEFDHHRGFILSFFKGMGPGRIMSDIMKSITGLVSGMSCRENKTFKEPHDELSVSIPEFRANI